MHLFEGNIEIQNWPTYDLNLCFFLFCFIRFGCFGASCVMDAHCTWWRLDAEEWVSERTNERAHTHRERQTRILHKKSRLKLVAIKSYNKIIIVLQFERAEVCFHPFCRSILMTCSCNSHDTNAKMLNM